MRKETTVIISAAGRDKGKVFHIREMPASQGERFALKVFHALARAKVDVPDNIAQSGMHGLARIAGGVIAALQFEDMLALMEEMFACVQIIPDPNRPGVMRRLIEDDIEEVATRLKLRQEILSLHIDFFATAASSTSQSGGQPAAQ